MKISSQELLKNLKETTVVVIEKVNKNFRNLSSEQLNWKSNQEKWSILECLEHLNIFADFYLKEIEKSMNNSTNIPKSNEYKGGIFGNYVAESMLIKDDKIKKMKTARSKNPSLSHLPDNVIVRFLEQQNRLFKLLDKSENMNLTQLKVSTDIAKWIKMRLGDILRFIVYHNERHIVQAEKVLDEMKVFNK